MDGMGQIGTRNGFGLGFGFWSIQSGMVGTCMCIVFVPLQRHGRKIYTYLVVNDTGTCSSARVVANFGGFSCILKSGCSTLLGKDCMCVTHGRLYQPPRA
jgi:hypothetical protein